jgi:poly-gamma-glutamate capsule biosynthesis protein CapA/YwtB (metallophosphatase superfamily)
VTIVYSNRRTWLASLVAVAAAALVACTGSQPLPLEPKAAAAAAEADAAGDIGPHRDGAPPRHTQPAQAVTLAFAGDMHFELQLAALLEHPEGALGPIRRALAGTDLSMVNLETSISHRGAPEAKELEVPGRRYHFRTSPAALRVLAAAGVDVATMANNHGADYGALGLRDTLRARRHSPLHVVGIGSNRRAAFTPYRVSIRGTGFAFFGADASFREGSSPVWAAGPGTAGLAAAHAARPRVLVDAVRAARLQGDVVVVYLHWGAELKGCPTVQQRITARALAEAGADIVVGSHAHVLLGSGWIADTYVDYGLGNFLWYSNQQPESGVLQLRVRGGRVIDDALVPATIRTDGRPLPLLGRPRAAAIADWRGLRACTGLKAQSASSREGSGSGHRASPTAYTATIRPIGPRLRDRMRYSHHPGCPVTLGELRYLQMSYLGFDGAVHTGEMVVHERYAAAVVGVFHRLYDARWPIRRMRLVDDFRGDDERSMAANNTSGYNCRRVAGTDNWSAHAYGAAIDINPFQNPYLAQAGTHEPPATRFTTIDRSGNAPVPLGAIREGDVVVRAFTGIGWDWGGHWSTAKDFQHFTDETVPGRARYGVRSMARAEQVTRR